MIKNIQMTRILLFTLIILPCAGVFPQADQAILEEISRNITDHEALYRHLHRNPELSFEEFKTSARLSAELESLGFEITRNVGWNGFVGMMRNGDGPVIMLRTDMDALPLQEKTGLPFASVVPGVMHACGHDMHMTVWLGTGKVLAAMSDSWNGTLMMVAQQAEERSGGANAMIADGLFKRFPVPDHALAYHVSPALKTGSIGYRPGPFMAGVNSVDVTVHGIGGHGAMPHNTIDPIVLASRMVLAFQTIPSREISPIEPVVVTVGSIHGGTVHNIIPDEVKMQMTIRFYNDRVYEDIIESIGRISAGIAQSAGLPESLYPQVSPLDHLTPPLINDANLTMDAVNSFVSVLGEQNVIEVEPFTVAEDFARYGRTEEKVPIAMFWLGATNPKKFEIAEENGVPVPQLHSPQFFPDFEPTYKTGVLGMSKAILDLFKK